MAYGKVNKTGCGVRQGNCQVRIDFYLDPTDPRYNDRYLYLVDTTSPEYLDGYKGEIGTDGIPIDQGDYDVWWASLPRVWQNTPFHSHFIYLPPTFTDGDIKAAIDIHLPNFYTAFQTEQDKVDGGMRHGWATETRIAPTDYSKFERAEDYNKRVIDCQASIDKLTEFTYKPSGNATGKTYPATAIDVGPGATDRTSSFVSSTTIDMANPANASGTLDTFEVWAYISMTGTNKVGTFYGSGTSYTNRDGQTIGTVTAGSKQTFTSLDIDVSSGDFAGIYHSTGNIERSTSGGSDIYYLAGDQFGTGPQTYGTYAEDAISIYATGETTVSDQPFRSYYPSILAH